jgi:hypothetical protein
MSRRVHRIEDAAADFWSLAGGRERYGLPIDLERAVSVALPLGIVKFPRLSTAKVADVLARIGTVPWSVNADRPLRACLVADVGVGLVFLDGGDPPEEQRFSLAHEVAHFLLHYQEPRRLAVSRLGPSAVEVLDRARQPTMAERLSSAMSGMSLEPFRHAMRRDAGGGLLHLRTENIEAEADDLALEMIAPASETLFSKDSSVETLVERYGLPIWAGDQLQLGTKESGGVINIFKKMNF